MGKGRLEAFSDGVIAIIITIMVLEMKIPRTTDLGALRPMLPVLLSYLLSFIYVGIYWANHHHWFHLARGVNGVILWANLHMLFWLSLVPVVTEWLGESHGAPWPAALYGAILLMVAFAWGLMRLAILAHEGKDLKIAKAVGSDWKGNLSLVIYLLGIAFSFVDTRISYAMYILVASMWIVPDRRFEQKLNAE